MPRRYAGSVAAGLSTAIAALIVSALAAASAPAQQPPPTKLSVKAKVTPNKAGTPRRPQAVRINVQARWNAPAGFERPVVTRAKALFPRGSLYNGGRYPRCSRNTLDFRGTRGCPRGAIMGRGRA